MRLHTSPSASKSRQTVPRPVFVGRVAHFDDDLSVRHHHGDASEENFEVFREFLSSRVAWIHRDKVGGRLHQLDRRRLAWKHKTPQALLLRGRDGLDLAKQGSKKEGKKERTTGIRDWKRVRAKVQRQKDGEKVRPVREGEKEKKCKRPQRKRCRCCRLDCQEESSVSMSDKKIMPRRPTLPLSGLLSEQEKFFFWR